MFYTYNQNNSYGRFDYDPVDGISRYVIVEADDAWEADYRAQRIGLYFNGSGDCPCCGRRWYEVGESDAERVPSVYGQPLCSGDVSLDASWMGGDPEGFIHYKDGRMEAVYADEGDYVHGYPARIVPWPFIEGEVITEAIAA